MLPRLRPNQVRVSHVRCRGIRLSAPRTAAAAIDPSIIGFFPVCTIFVRKDGLRKLSVSNIIISVLGLYEDKRARSASVGAAAAQGLPPPLFSCAR